jgi:hypothetical protein
MRLSPWLSLDLAGRIDPASEYFPEYIPKNIFWFFTNINTKNLQVSFFLRTFAPELKNKSNKQK